MTGPAVRFELTSVVRTFTMTFLLAESEPMARGKYINRQYRRGGTRQANGLKQFRDAERHRRDRVDQRQRGVRY